MSLSPKEKAAIEAQRRQKPSLRRWYPESPLEAVEGLPEWLKPEDASKIVHQLEDVYDDEEKGIELYRVTARLLKDLGFPEIADELALIILDETLHKGKIEALLKRFGWKPL